MVLDGSIRVASGACVNACVFFFEGRRGTLEIEELDGCLACFFEGVVTNSDGVTDRFVTDIGLVLACGLDFREIDQRGGGVASRNPGLCGGSGYLESFFATFGLEDDFFAFGADNGHLLLTLSKEADLVVVGSCCEQAACTKSRNR